MAVTFGIRFGTRPPYEKSSAAKPDLEKDY
jgi:hypothetical protein